MLKTSYEMTYFDATVWDWTRDQYGRPCWADKSSGRVTYQLQDGNGLALLPHGGVNSPVPCATGTVPVGMGNAPTGQGMAPMAAVGSIVPAAGAWVVPAVGPSMGTVAIVGGKCKEDKWTEYTDDNGKKYYHNPAKGETTWEKPKDFDKKKDGKPPPPATEKKEKKKSPKYIVTRGWF